MTVREFVNSISGFTNFSRTEQIKRFCWYLDRHEKKTTFSGTDIAKCFDGASCPRPSSITGFLTSLIKQKPPYLIKRNSGYTLSLHGHTHLDTLLGKRETTVAVDNLLTALPSKLTINYERVYLEEALICFRNSAFRAAIVMAWNLGYDHLCNVILTTHLSAFNRQLPVTYPKADILAIVARDDFTALKEHQVLQVAKSANIISGSVHKVLKEKLDRRNIAAHPSGVAISQLTAEEFILDLTENVVLKL